MSTTLSFPSAFSAMLPQAVSTPHSRPPFERHSHKILRTYFLPPVNIQHFPNDHSSTRSVIGGLKYSTLPATPTCIIISPPSLDRNLGPWSLPALPSG